MCSYRKTDDWVNEKTDYGTSFGKRNSTPMAVVLAVRHLDVGFLCVRKGSLKKGKAGG